jgi:hypothetical protein
MVGGRRCSKLAEPRQAGSRVLKNCSIRAVRPGPAAACHGSRGGSRSGGVGAAAGQGAAHTAASARRLRVSPSRVDSADKHARRLTTQKRFWGHKKFRAVRSQPADPNLVAPVASRRQDCVQPAARTTTRLGRAAAALTLERGTRTWHLDGAGGHRWRRSGRRQPPAPLPGTGKGSWWQLRTCEVRANATYA